MTSDGILTCPECGLAAEDEESTCLARWHLLLALDHSHERPWGPLHGVAFATYTLQHPESVPHASVERSWLVLHRLLVHGDDRGWLFKAIRQTPVPSLEEWNVPPLPVVPPRHFTQTIGALGDFAAAGYEARLLEWARMTLDDWNRRPSAVDHGSRYALTARRSSACVVTGVRSHRTPRAPLPTIGSPSAILLLSLVLGKGG